MVAEPLGLAVRDMRPDEVRLRVDYFHDATDEDLSTMGVGRHLLPPRDAWERRDRDALARPFDERPFHALVWELDGEVVGFSTADRIRFGTDAAMHLHVVDPFRRRRGLGARFVRMSAETYIVALRLERLFSEPNAFNLAPNRTLQRAGFRYLLSHRCTPGPINVPQVTTRWVLDAAAVASREGDGGAVGPRGGG